jgi:hypothetical protein
MIRILLFIGLALSFSANLVLADMSPMAGKHIFTPDVISESKEEAPQVAKVINGSLEKEILFTGIIISPKGRFAILKENVTNDKTGLKHILKQGEQIKGMTIQEIGSNFVLLAGSDNTTLKMNLYKGAKARPAPVLAEVKPELPPGLNHQQAHPAAETDKTPDAQAPGEAQAAEKEIASPFGGGGNSPKGKVPQQQDGGAQANPFADVLNKASKRNPSAVPTNPFNHLPINQ